MEYNRTRHAVHLVNYHLVWCPKYRKKVLVGKVRNRLEELIKAAASTDLLSLIALEVMPDHLHLFVSTSPNVPPSVIVKDVKGKSSRGLREEFPHLGRLPTLWTSSYFVSSAGNVSSVTVRKYIEVQRVG